MTNPTAVPPTSVVNHNRRRLHYIKPSFQRRFIFQFCLLVTVGCGVFGLLLYWYAGQTLTTAFIHSKLRVMSTADFLLPALGFAMVIVAVLVAVAAAMRLLVFSHKIAGPLYRIEQSAEAVGRGELDLDIKLRTGDELQDVARTMHGMASDLREQIRLIRERAQRLRHVISQASHQSATPSELVRQLEEAQGQLDAALSRFRV